MWNKRPHSQSFRFIILIGLVAVRTTRGEAKEGKPLEIHRLQMVLLLKLKQDKH